MVEISEGIFVGLEFDGVNVGAIRVDDDLFCVDSPSYPRDARRWATSLRSIHPKHARYLILTDGNGDRILNTRWLNAPIIIQQRAAEKIGGLKRRYPQPWLASLSARNPAAGKELASGPIELASLSYSTEMRIIADGLTLVLRHEPGPTSSSSWVWIPERRIVFTGDCVVNGTYPPVAEINSADWIRSLTKLSLLATEIDTIVPGRGPLCDTCAADGIIEYLQLVRNTVQKHIDAGKMQESLSDYVDEFATYFPSEALPIDWIRSQVASGLLRVYQELTTEDYLDSSLFTQS